MNINEIKDILAQVMYMESSDEIDPDASIFDEYEMNSIDLIDFTYEIKKKGNLDFSDETLWPFNSIANNPEFYDSEKLEWTPEGLTKINTIINPEKPIEDKFIKTNNLYKYFSVNYVLNRISNIK